jgi:hypothetical protein
MGTEKILIHAQASLSSFSGNPKYSGVSWVLMQISYKCLTYLKKKFQYVTPLFLCFNASEVTLSGFAGGEYLPLPASKGPAFPFLLTLDGSPLLQQITLRNNGVP